VDPSANSPVLRLLDANANRAREGLRVIEDYARFVLDDSGLCQRLKNLRHELTEAFQPIAHQAILHRDTPGDVGTTIQASQPMPRQNVADVVTAAGKRLGEPPPLSPPQELRLAVINFTTLNRPSRARCIRPGDLNRCGSMC
jgi:thiamine-phosphate pyrophosphorylase